MPSERTLFIRLGAWLPMVLSILAIGLVLTHAMVLGRDRAADEGTAAHVFQLLLVLQVPIIALFIRRWFGSDRHRTMRVLGVQAGLIAIAIGCVLLFV
ncbi:MAG: hypothetical protein KDB88_08400 [Flavobacteriales bacterium]|nr:hypothetical protein [Flavobacteriales bacterium]